MEQGFYYPHLASTSSVSDINSFLKLSLPDSAGVSWAISLNSTSPTEYGTATRTGTGADGRIWTINFPGETDAACSGGTACP
ncbi:MAG TPA: hypothetical protein PKI44_06455 [Candidatus Omnitrophota bacterium]|nr:hypothetical protein [Candidatus Omnitrophota bacterium]